MVEDDHLSIIQEIRAQVLYIHSASYLDGTKSKEESQISSTALTGGGRGWSERK